MTQSDSEPISRTQAQTRIKDCLTQALEAEMPEKKNYHVRRALQYCVSDDDSRS
jgi:hypothetical protein